MGELAVARYHTPGDAPRLDAAETRGRPDEEVVSRREGQGLVAGQAVEGRQEARSREQDTLRVADGDAVRRRGEGEGRAGAVEGREAGSVETRGPAKAGDVQDSARGEERVDAPGRGSGDAAPAQPTVLSLGHRQTAVEEPGDEGIAEAREGRDVGWAGGEGVSSRTDEREPAGVPPVEPLVGVHEQRAVRTS